MSSNSPFCRWKLAVRFKEIKIRWFLTTLHPSPFNAGEGLLTRPIAMESHQPQVAQKNPVGFEGGEVVGFLGGARCFLVTSGGKKTGKFQQSALF